MKSIPAASQFWRDQRALEESRRRALEWARRELERRRSSGRFNTQVFMSSHTGVYHLQFFRDEFPQIINLLPEGFRALEVGAGLGWLSALLTAHSTGSVIATEIMWGPSSPYELGNVHTFDRLLKAEPRLADVIEIVRDESGAPRAIKCDARIAFVKAAAEALPAADGSLDLLYSQNCLEHIPGLGDYFREAARVLRVGGIFYSATEPLYFSPFGHHLDDIFPVPWGHLLWEPEELAELAVREAGEREWEPGVPLRAEHLLDILRNGLNYASPKEIRAGLLRGPWSIAGWSDLVIPDHETMMRGLGLRDALQGVGADELLLMGLRIKLRREDSARGMRLPMRLGVPVRRRMRRLYRWR